MTDKMISGTKDFFPPVDQMSWEWKKSSNSLVTQLTLTKNALLILPTLVKLDIIAQNITHFLPLRSITNKVVYGRIDFFAFDTKLTDKPYRKYNNSPSLDLWAFCRFCGLNRTVMNRNYNEYIYLRLLYRGDDISLIFEFPHIVSPQNKEGQ